MGSKKILITGANGFIGSFIVEEALKQKLEVFAGVRKNSNITPLDKFKIAFVELDYEDVESMRKLIQQYQFDYIIHNAGITKSPFPEEYMRVNHGYLINMVQAIRASEVKIEKFLFVSSLAATGPADFQKSGILDKNTVPHPVTHYGVSKLAAESYLTKQNDIPYVILRPTAVYGPREKDLLNVFQLLNKRVDLSAGLLPQKMTFIYVKDLASLMITALLSPIKHKAYFATDGKVYTGDALSGFIKESLNKRTFKLKLPIFVISIIAYLSEKLAGIWDSYPPLNIDKVNEIKARNWSCNVDDLKSELSFSSQYDLSTGIPETVEWYKKNKWL